MISKVEKRDGKKADFDKSKIEKAVFKALTSSEQGGEPEAKKVADRVLELLLRRFSRDEVPHVEEIQDIVEEVLINKGYDKAAKDYILYREKRREVRETEAELDKSMKVIGDYIEEMDWEVKENANMTYSLQGLNQYVTSHVSKKYWLNKIYPKKIREAAKNEDMHIHDLNLLATYCCGWDLQDLLIKGFGGVSSKIESAPPKHLRPALGQVVNFFFTLQGESAGAQAMSNFDTFLAPFIAYDKLDYGQVKQAMQEFLFNCMVPTRVGFQCLSEDTEVLTKDGWRNYEEVEKGDIIKTFNVEKATIEDKKIKKVFRKEYKGEMYNAVNRIQNQLLSPGHRMVRKKFNSENYCLEEVEKVTELNSPQAIPIAADNDNEKIDLSDEEIKLIAWIISEGSLEVKGNWRRVVIYQSKEQNPEKYEEIISLLEVLEIEYTIQEGVESLGQKVAQIRFNSENSRSILEWFDEDDDVKKVPEKMLEMSQSQSRVFLETYIKGDGHEGCKITVSNEKIRDDLQQIIVNSGYGFTTSQRQDSGVGNKLLYILRVIRHQETYLRKIEKVDYQGIIWSVNTENETVIARRKGSVFITGNTPFINTSLDIKVPEHLKDQPVIIGGEPQEATYGEFQEEMDMFNRAFYEVIMEGDSKGRVFTFPIPTISITDDFDWNNEALKPMWEATTKYGVNYFSNYMNSDMDPADFRSMCCRLRLDNNELIKRGGGLFGSKPLTGSLGVVTVNMPRLGYLSETEKEFYNRLEKIMDLAKDSLEIKRKVINNFMEKGLYPYSKHYLEGVKEMRGTYYGNHFSTIGLIGMNEACLNFLDKGIGSEEGKKFSEDVLDFMNKKLIEYQQETDNLYNLEATPGEGTAYKQAKIDKSKFPDIITAGTEEVPYYTNSVHLPVNYSDDPMEIIDHQDDLQTKFTGGTVIHLFLGEKISEPAAAKNLIKNIFKNYELPYLSLTPSFSVCPACGYIHGEKFRCPKCKIKKPKKVTKKIN